MCAFRPCISFTPKNTKHRFPTDLGNAVENQAAGLFFIYRFLLSLQEGRLVAASQRRAFPNFNSRPCERGDWPSPAPQPARAYFNSRPCERGDHPPPRGRPAVKISIHAPARGATIKEYQQAIELPISIHAPARGATSAGDQERCPGADFNSRPCERGDAAREVVRKRANISIHAPARGATCPGGTHKITPKHFNSRPCEGGDGKIKQNMLCFFCNYREKLPTFRQHQLS